MTEYRDYDLELSDLIERFGPHNLLIKKCMESNLIKNNQPIVTLRWVDDTTKCGEPTNANS